MFADDSLKWRFTFNSDKCAVVIFDNRPKIPEIKHGNCTDQCTCGFHWKLGNRLIKQEASYKYLGIELDRKLGLQQFKKRICEKARQAMSTVWGMGMYNGCLSVKASINVYEALVRSILEYGAQIWEDEEFEEGEMIQ